MTLYHLAAEAQDDLFEIWSRSAEDSVELANRIDEEFHELFASLGRMPAPGHARKDLTKRPV
jgi:plasmid stabilization system protein ParE